MSYREQGDTVVLTTRWEGVNFDQHYEPFLC